MFGKWLPGIFFKNDIWSGNIFFIPFRIDRKVVEDKVFNLCALKKNYHLLGVEI